MILKNKFHYRAIRSAILYGGECWPIKKTQVKKLAVAEMRISRWIYSHTLLDKIKNDFIHSKVRVVPIEDKLREARLRWFGHVMRRNPGVPVRRCEKIVLGSSMSRKSRGRPKKRWGEVIK